MDFKSWSGNKQKLHTEELLKYQAALRGREHEKENQKERRRMKQPEGKKGKKKKKTQTGIDLEDK